MQLILQNCFRDELIARQKYFYETFHLWLIVNSKDNNYIKLTSMPTNCLDILFIIGHNTFVKEYLKCHEITEKRIVAITCDGTIRFASLTLPGKILYIPYQNEENYADLLHGKLYGFDFDLTESEILLYNANKSVDVFKRLEDTFYKL